MKEDIYRVEVTVELEVPKDMVTDNEQLGKELAGEFVKVKGGKYEDTASGFITSVGKISSDVREWGEVKSDG